MAKKEIMASLRAELENLGGEAPNNATEAVLRQKIAELQAQQDLDNSDDNQTDDLNPDDDSTEESSPDEGSSDKPEQKDGEAVELDHDEIEVVCRVGFKNDRLGISLKKSGDRFTVDADTANWLVHQDRTCKFAD